MTLSIMTLITIWLVMTLSVNSQHNSIECHYAKSRYAERRDYLNIMLSVVMLNVIMLNVFMLNVVMVSVIMLNVVMLNVVTLNVVMLSVIMLSVVAPLKGFLYRESLN